MIPALLFLASTGLAFYYLRRIPSAEEQRAQVALYLQARRREEAQEQLARLQWKIDELKDAFRDLGRAAVRASGTINTFQSQFKAVS